MADLIEENTTAWLTTTASQIFIMQLGFLSFEVGFVKSIWTESIILKNIEDTFVGLFTFLSLGYTLSESPRSFYGIISIPDNPLLIGVDIDIHDQIFISSLFATTTATIISGAVLQRMKNKVYIVWCSLIILFNYSFVSHWIWHEDGWLSKMGFVDGAGAVVVHSTAGMAAAIAVCKLGPRKEAKGKDNKLLPVERAAKPIVYATGAFILWYGWFAFNVSSPIAFNRGLGDSVGTIALVTAVSPVCSAFGAFIWMRIGWVKLTFEDLLSCILSGLVSITGACHSCNVIEAGVIGFCSSIVYFMMARILRNKFQIDDPLQVIPIHYCCGIFSCFAEGIVANGVYGTYGLIFGEYEHFLVQCLGITVVSVFNFCLCSLLYFILEKLIFHNTSIRVSTLDTYLGTKLFAENIDSALKEVLKCDSNVGKRMLWWFHQYMKKQLLCQQLDFLIVFQILDTILEDKNVKNTDRIAQYILQIMDTYIEDDAKRWINVCLTQRAILSIIKQRLLSELENNLKSEEINEEEKSEKSSKTKTKLNNKTNRSKTNITQENVFNAAHANVWRIVQPHFTSFLLHSFEPIKKEKFSVRIPFKLNQDWTLEWDQQLSKQKQSQRLTDTVPKHTVLIEKMEKNESTKNNIHGEKLQSMTSLRSMAVGQVQLAMIN